MSPIILLPTRANVPVPCYGTSQDIFMMLVPTGSAAIGGTQSYDLSFVDGAPAVGEATPCYGDVLQNTQNWATVETPNSGLSFIGATHDPDRQVLAVAEADFSGTSIMIKEYNFNSSTFGTPQTPFAKSTLTAFPNLRADITFDLVEKDKYYIHDVGGTLYSVPAPIANGAPVASTSVFTGIPTGGAGTPGLVFTTVVGRDSIWIRTGDVWSIREYNLSPGNEGIVINQASFTHTRTQFRTFGGMYGHSTQQTLQWVAQDTGYFSRNRDAGGGFFGLVEQGCSAPTQSPWASCPSGNGYQTKWRNDTGRVIGPTSGTVVSIGGWPYLTNPFL